MERGDIKKGWQSAHAAATLAKSLLTPAEATLLAALPEWNVDAVSQALHDAAAALELGVDIGALAPADPEAAVVWLWLGFTGFMAVRGLTLWWRVRSDAWMVLGGRP